MDRHELDKETKATKKTKNIWKWIVGVGIVLFLIAFFGGYLNHDEDFFPGTAPMEAVPVDTSATDSTSPRTE
jgi:peptidoglycan biosynthesis protein MviN/MurJ (putative lipid II flippase)